jgi:hypothetical protein
MIIFVLQYCHTVHHNIALYTHPWGGIAWTSILTSHSLLPWDIMICYVSWQWADRYRQYSKERSYILVRLYYCLPPCLTLFIETLVQMWITDKSTHISSLFYWNYLLHFILWLTYLKNSLKIKLLTELCGALRCILVFWLAVVGDDKIIKTIIVNGQL